MPQRIIITDRPTNRAIQQAIPKLMRDLGYSKKRATAAAIRMGSVGQLAPSGEFYSVKVARGAAAIASIMVQKAMKKRNEPTRTEINNGLQGVVVTSPAALGIRYLQQTRTIKPSK
tara:strand:- start:1063 stop:1410 length:348 start_codon:yes stop_codon:yes gene_type:complete